MKLEGYEVKIIGANERVIGEAFYQELLHAQTYKVKLTNYNPTRCDAVLTIDGKEIGTYRVENFGSITVERKLNDPGQFTFFKVDTVEAQYAKINENEALGLVRVDFFPEYQRVLESFTKEPMVLSAPSASAGVTRSSRAGGTGLSGYSSQQFVAAERIEYDYSKVITLFTRLISAEVTKVSAYPRPL